MNDVEMIHKSPEGFAASWAYFSVQCITFMYDLFSGYKFGSMTERKWLIRIIFTETLAGVPGMVSLILLVVVFRCYCTFRVFRYY